MTSDRIYSEPGHASHGNVTRKLIFLSVNTRKLPVGKRQCRTSSLLSGSPSYWTTCKYGSVSKHIYVIFTSTKLSIDTFIVFKGYTAGYSWTCYRRIGRSVPTHFLPTVPRGCPTSREEGDEALSLAHKTTKRNLFGIHEWQAVKSGFCPDIRPKARMRHRR